MDACSERESNLRASDRKLSEGGEFSADALIVFSCSNQQHAPTERVTHI